uniref:Uncharacterized protein n=1 Tax=Rhizophora mucronata TaxID=61149 RepID=A0A2P2J2M9_RHIMU
MSSIRKIDSEKNLPNCPWVMRLENSINFIFKQSKILMKNLMLEVVYFFAFLLSLVEQMIAIPTKPYQE